MEDFLKQDAQILQHHLSDALSDHSKLVDTVVVWTALMRSAFSRGQTYRGMDHDARFVAVGDIDDETIRAMRNGLNVMRAGDHCIFCDPWRSFAQLGITAEAKQLNPALTPHVPTVNADLEREAQLVQTHLTASLDEHRKLVNAVAAWTSLMYNDPGEPKLNDEVANDLATHFRIDIDTIRAMKNGLNRMIELEHLVEFDPWLAFERLGVGTDVELH
jgi:hypothetical protein